MNHREACELIDRVLTCAYDETESWSDNDVGMHLAYLAWEIARGEGGTVDWRVSNAQPILALFDKLLAEDDAVWKFIARPSVRHFVIVGQRASSDAPMLSAHVVAPSPEDAINKFMQDYLFKGEEMPAARGAACNIVSVVEIKGAPIAAYDTIELLVS